MQPEAFFLPVKTPGSTQISQRFCLFYPARGDVLRGMVLYVHPFAEEMNKSRRMAALQARAFAQEGYSVLQIDLLGCGDSSGDFGDATWQDWINDVVQGCRWLLSRVNTLGVPGKPHLWLWGLRAGCLLAVDAVTELNYPCNFLFWQPPALGKPLLQQFLRLKVAGDILGSQSKGVMQAMRQQLASGSLVEIAGYSLSPELASGLEQATLLPTDCEGSFRRVEWFELSTQQNASLSLVSAKTLDEWQRVGFNARAHIVHGPAFWQTSEIEDVPSLHAATTKALTSFAA